MTLPADPRMLQTIIQDGPQPEFWLFEFEFKCKYAVFRARGETQVFVADIPIFVMDKPFFPFIV